MTTAAILYSIVFLAAAGNFCSWVSNCSSAMVVDLAAAEVALFRKPNLPGAALLLLALGSGACSIAFLVYVVNHHGWSKAVGVVLGGFVGFGLASMAAARFGRALVALVSVPVILFAGIGMWLV